MPASGLTGPVKRPVTVGVGPPGVLVLEGVEPPMEVGPSGIGSSGSQPPYFNGKRGCVFTP